MKPPEIRKLDSVLISKIAAGEVVERPASAVKELVENAIDANATKIDIDFKSGGKAYIRVADNGCGMTKEQALLSLEQHATSKIFTEQDLNEIKSYGFRGEAVPSIAAVSQFTIKTRPEDSAAGTEIFVNGGKLEYCRECGAAFGTEITAANLFCSVPARRKFLKSDNTEAMQIVRLCKSYALALPDISFTLRENAKTIFKSAKGFGLIDAIEKIYGRDLAEKLTELGVAQKGALKIYGAISKPDVSFATSRNIYAFINNRPVESKTVFFALKEAYAPFIPQGKYAGGFIFIEIDPKLVDVNVHPAKREVRFNDERFVGDFLCECVSKKIEALANPFAETKKENPSPELELKPAIFPSREKPKNIEYVRPLQVNDCVAAKTLPQKEEIHAHGNAAFLQSQSESNPQKSTLPDWQFMGSFANYIFFKAADSVKIVEATNAKKRIVFDSIIDSLESENRPLTQTLLLPLCLQLDRLESEILRSNLEQFSACGFEIEEFGKDFFRILSLPQWAEISQAEIFVRDFLELKKTSASAKAADINYAFAMSAAQSIRGTTPPDCAESAKQLLSELFKCQNAANAPDGAYIIKSADKNFLARLFK